MKVAVYRLVGDGRELLSSYESLNGVAKLTAGQDIGEIRVSSAGAEIVRERGGKIGPGWYKLEDGDSFLQALLSLRGRFLYAVEA